LIYPVFRFVTIFEKNQKFRQNTVCSFYSVSLRTRLQIFCSYRANNTSRSSI